LQGDRTLQMAPSVRTVELGRVTHAFVWHQFEIFAAEGVAATGAEIRERHLVGTADFSVQMVNLAREPVRRKPFGQRVRVEKCPIDLLGRRTQYAVKPDGVGRHYMLLSLDRSSRSQ